MVRRPQRARSENAISGVLPMRERLNRARDLYRRRKFMPYLVPAVKDSTELVVRSAGQSASRHPDFDLCATGLTAWGFLVSALTANHAAKGPSAEAPIMPSSNTQQYG